MRYGVISSRAMKDYGVFTSMMPSPCSVTELITGGGLGVDYFAARWADENDVPLCEIKPDFMKHGHNARVNRDFRIINDCDWVLVFWDMGNDAIQELIKYACSTNKYISIVAI